MSIEKELKKDVGSQDQVGQHIERVSAKSSLELIEQRIKELFPLLVRREKMEDVRKALYNLVNNSRETLDSYSQVAGGVVPEIQKLVHQSQFLRTAGLSEDEIKITQFWRDGLKEAAEKLFEIGKELNEQINRLVAHTDSTIGSVLKDAVNLRVGLDYIREATVSEDDYRVIMEDILSTHR